MRNTLRRSLLLLLIVAMIVSFRLNQYNTATAKMAPDPNPLLAEWRGPYGGVPRFDLVKIEYFKPALEAAMTEQLAEIEKIASDKSAPTFENTIVAMERGGQTLDRVSTIYGVWGSTMASPEFQV